MCNKYGYAIGYRRVVRNVIALSKKSGDGVLPFSQVQCFTFRTITHMNMVSIFANRLAQI